MNKPHLLHENSRNHRTDNTMPTDIGIFAYDKHWQKPAATEEAAFRAMSTARLGSGFDYIGVAWATLIDGVARRSENARDVLRALARMNRELPRVSRKRCTVAQHIRTAEFIEVFSAMGITDLFWSHATNAITELNGIRIHPFPLFPAQAPAFIGDNSTEKRYLANFVGAYNPKIYLSNVRKIIFQDAGTDPALKIIKRGQWHFDRKVYHEQIQGRTPSEAELSKEDADKQEYLEAIQSSWFTLCPTGSGPNSIRVFECLALGSIPIILTKDLRLNGDMSLWQRAAIIEEDSEQGYRRALDAAKRLSISDRLSMLEAGKRLHADVGPGGYGNVIVEKMSIYEK